MARKSPEERIRAKRVQVSFRPDIYDAVVASADEVGLSVNAWCAYTLGNAAMTGAKIRERMTDEMLTMLHDEVEARKAAGDDD